MNNKYSIYAFLIINLLMPSVGQAKGVIGSVIAELVGGAVGKAIGGSVNTPPKNSMTVDEALIGGLQEAAKKINLSAPKMIDKDTRIDSVSVGPGARAVYHYSFPAYASNAIDANQLQITLIKKLRPQLCANKEMANSLQLGAMYVYSYTGNDGIEITRFETDKNTCNITIKSETEHKLDDPAQISVTACI